MNDVTMYRLSFRDQCAIAAMQGVLSNPTSSQGDLTANEYLSIIVDQSFEIADKINQIELT